MHSNSLDASAASANGGNRMIDKIMYIIGIGIMILEFAALIFLIRAWRKAKEERNED